MNRPVFSALVLFLFPALIVAAIVAVLNFVSLRYVSEQQTEGSKIVQQGLSLLDRAIGLVVQGGLLHDEVSRQLLQADSGKLNEADAYRIHVYVVDHLALIESEARALQPEMLEAGLDQSLLDVWTTQFVEYRNLALMATDIVAIEPRVASRYVNQAQSVFFNLSAQTFTLTSQLSDRVNVNVVNCQKNIQRQFRNTYWIIVVGIVLALMIALVSSRYLSSQWQVLMVQMRRLSKQHSIPDQLPEVERLGNSSSSEIRHLAHTVLSFHRVLKERDEEQQRIYQLAFHDRLTGLPNRVKMLELVEDRLRLRQQDLGLSALIKLNVNRLKVVNDGLGYEQGDLLLMQVGQRLCEGMTQTCVLARSSGDEFLMMLDYQGFSEQEATHALTQTMSAIHQLFDRPFVLKEQQVFVTVVLGATLFPSLSKLSETAEDVFMRAMIALHSAKVLTSEQQSLIYHDTMEDQAKQRIQLESHLRYAIEYHHLILFFQPQVDGDGQVVSVETLVRWQDPHRGLISPAAFIPMAEQSDLIIDVDRWVLREACLALRQLQVAGRSIHVSVNISGKHFAKDFFVRSIMDVVEMTGVDPKGLMLEVTEGIFIADLDSVIEKMEQLKAHGMRFSIDDFGTGYSSLQYLKRLPIHELKIDKSFIDHVPQDSGDVALVKTIASIAQNLNLSVVVEGVETQQQVLFLKHIGNFVLQGYYYARPQPAQLVIEQLIG